MNSETERLQKNIESLTENLNTLSKTLEEKTIEIDLKEK